MVYEECAHIAKFTLAHLASVVMFNRFSRKRQSSKYKDFDVGDPSKLFELKDCLGEGTYGMVWVATEKATGRDMALKIVPIDNDLEEIEQECEVMKISTSPYVVKLYGSYISNDKCHVWMAMEICEAGSVNDFMYITDKIFEENVIREIAAGVILGLVYLQSKYVVHRDIKCGNILLDKRGHIKLADFGVSAVGLSKNDKHRTAIGAPYWMAPEVILEEPYDCRADIWSLGISVIEMAEARPPHSNIHPMRALFMIPKSDAPTLTEPEKWSTSMVSFIHMCLQKDMKNRKTAEELANHPFVADTISKLESNHGVSEVLKNLVNDNMEMILRYRIEDGESSLGGSTLSDELDSCVSHDTSNFKSLVTRRKPIDSVRNLDPIRTRSGRIHSNRISTKSGVSSRSGTSSASGGSERSNRPQTLFFTETEVANKQHLERKSQKQKARSVKSMSKLLARKSNGAGFEGDIFHKSVQGQIKNSADILRILQESDSPSPRHTRRGLGPTNIAAAVLTKDFIRMLKESQKRHPAAFECLSDLAAERPEEAVDFTVGLLRAVAGLGQQPKMPSMRPLPPPPSKAEF